MPFQQQSPDPPLPSRPRQPRGDPATASFRRTKALWQLPSEQVTLGVSTLLSVRIRSSRGAGEAFRSPSELAAQAAQFADEGAEIIEIQGFDMVAARDMPTAEEETALIVPVLRKVVAACNCPVSVLCCHASSAQRAVELGASIIHDPTGLTFDKDLPSVVNESGAALIAGHMRGTPWQWARMAPLPRLVETVRVDVRASLLRAAKAGIERKRIVLDPGLEHGKRGYENFTLLRSMRRLGPPAQGLQATLARRRFMVDSIRASKEERSAGVAVAATLAVQSGAHILSVDDYETVRHIVRAVDRIYRLDDAAAALSPFESDMRRPAGR